VYCLWSGVLRGSPAATSGRRPSDVCLTRSAHVVSSRRNEASEYPSAGSRESTSAARRATRTMPPDRACEVELTAPGSKSARNTPKQSASATEEDLDRPVRAASDRFMAFCRYTLRRRRRQRQPLSPAVVASRFRFSEFEPQRSTPQGTGDRPRPSSATDQRWGKTRTETPGDRRRVGRHSTLTARPAACDNRRRDASSFEIERVPPLAPGPAPSEGRRCVCYLAPSERRRSR
jgi:hypothetical protein